MAAMRFLTRLFAVLLCCVWLTPSALAGYTDTDNEEGITYLEIQGAIDPGNEFRPDDTLKKGEAFKIIFKLFGEEAPEYTADRFKDVDGDEWFAPYAELAYRYDLTSKSSENFRASKEMRRVDVLDLLVEAYGMGSPIVPRTGREDLFADVNEYHPFYVSIHRAVEGGVLSADTDEHLYPYEHLTRGEFAELIFQFEQIQTETIASAHDFYKSDIFTTVWNSIITDFYLNEDEYINVDALMQAALKGMVNSLEDPYSQFYGADESSFMDSLSGDYEGIGAYLHHNESTGGYIITDFVDDAPAQAAGLQTGDEIIAVDEVSILEMSMESVVRRIRGPRGTTVRITVLRSDEEYTFEVTRAALEMKLESAENWKKDTWLIDINSFSRFTGDNIADELEVLAEEGTPDAIIIDVRGNSGGALRGATELLSLFFPQDETLLHLDYSGYLSTIVNAEEGPYQDIDMYVLVDEFSASASEIVASTLQESAGATVIGMSTYGKGSAQEIHNFWDGSSFKLTVAHWLTPNKNSIHGIGVSPDISISGSSVTKDLWLEEVLDQL